MADIYYRVNLKFSRSCEPESTLVRYIRNRMLKHFRIDVWVPSYDMNDDGSFTVYLYGPEYECLRWFEADYNDGREFHSQIPDININYRVPKPKGIPN